LQRVRSESNRLTDELDEEGEINLDEIDRNQRR
jgi:hypothetical protein